MGANSANILDQLRKRIDAIINTKPSHKKVLEFLKEVMVEQYRMKASTKTVPIRIDEEKNQAFLEGNPLLDKKELCLDIPSATKLFKRLRGLLGRSEKTSGDAKRINEALRNKDLNLAELFKHVATENNEYISALSERLKVKDDLLSFLAGNSIRPVFEVYASQLKGYVDQEMWWRGYCPICGSMPFISEFREEGERFLACSLCGFEWRFMRVKCPFCENGDHKMLRYFYTQSEGTANRVDVCEKCKKYIKTLDTREMVGDVIPIIEDMGTLYLDVLAQEEGYLRAGISHGGFTVKLRT